MPLDLPYRSVTTRVFRTIPDGIENDPLDPSFSMLSSRNRWNSVGEATLYLAGDARVAAAEWARHVAVPEPHFEVKRQGSPRRIFTMTLAVDDAVDLRDPLTCRVLDIVGAPNCFLEGVPFCQVVSTHLRRESDAQALIVPSMALLDQPERFVVVLFVDKLPTYPEPFVTAVEARGMLPAEL